MSGPTRKTDYFGTFLDTFRSSTGGVTSGSVPPAPAAAAPAPQGRNLDAALLALRDAGPDGLPLKDLITRFDNSLDVAFDALSRLQMLGLVAKLGEGFALTPAGIAAAGALKA